jgi:putative tryptophan/tyrosine transport system substrate-binding protein
LATDLVNIGTKVIITTGSEPSALAAKAATSKTPIVFVVDGDPVNIGLVDSLNNPGANVTGMSLISPALEAKRLGLLREVVPKSALMAVLANEDYPDTDRQLAGVETAAEEIGQKISIQNVRSERDLDSAFTTMSQLNVDALLVAADPLFTELSRHPQLHRTCPLSGVKRTWLVALQMSAYDPKRTSQALYLCQP